ncbi:MAG: hypothetical protein M1830_007653 [Pleopsidium flavum]|nr:MAG: hypothetical protein M1830_007653 [Pleopsidium flavum]
MRNTKLTRCLRTIQPGLIDLLPTAASPRYASRCPLGLAFDHHRRISTTIRCASSTSTTTLPRVAQPSLWHSVVPKFLRRSEPALVPAAVSAKPPNSKEWNPATFYIVIFLLIGSQAIQTIALRNELIAYSRKADAKISVLKEVIERVQRGEDVDVQGLLGTGDKAKEKEWEDVLQEIVEEDALWQKKSRRRKDNTIAEDRPDRDATSATSDTAKADFTHERLSPKDASRTSGKSGTPPHAFY